ncbi:MAG: 1-acyl-sn-glycerol-3-phosphate acyltransferase, partial [Candidatus Marinimicrobia bacterium]|nr:1-acyl-sn-glycerol-3-phosphate acyltransferase [Candidatus Neomarinimicrobiota bacterium]
SRAILVANHWGYLDSLILMSISPCLVISNMDVRRMPVVGWLMHVMGFVFVDRSSNSSIPAALNKASDEVSKAGINMALFPEGGTGDGTHLKPFHSSFFQMAIDTGYDVQPLLIRILNINSEKITSENIDRVIFHGHKVNVVSHILQMLNNRSITISVDLLPRLNRETITNNNLSRKEICLMTETAINHRFNQYLRLSNEIPSI